MTPVPSDGETMGEIMFRGNLVMRGYLKNPKATRADVVQDLEPHVCRCGAHVRILQAVETAAAAMRGEAR